jgi:hypothetical protein
MIETMQSLTPADVTIRRFEEPDAGAVRALFITVNRLLSPPDMRAAFEDYIARSLAEENLTVGAMADDDVFWINFCLVADFAAMATAFNFHIVPIPAFAHQQFEGPWSTPSGK